VKRLTWHEDAVLSVRLRPDLYTLAQMRQNSLMQFFDLRSEDGSWADVDLTTVEPLFCVYVAERRLKPLLVAVVPPEDVQPNRRPTPTLMITYRFSGDGDHQADLIELTDGYTSIGAEVVQEGLSIEDDLDVVYGHEYVGMFGDPEKLRTRLVRWFDTGVNWDDSKVHVFKGIQPPPPVRSSTGDHDDHDDHEVIQPSGGEPSPTQDVGLMTYSRTDYLRAVHGPLRRKVQPHFTDLITDLAALPAGGSEDPEGSEAQVLALFETCIGKVNANGDDIGTSDREALLEAIYDIGAIVGLDPQTRFAERWRGDW
jgi:hypothetical protein